MKTRTANSLLPLKFFSAALLLGASLTASAADKPPLKDAYKDHFMVGVAINRTIATDSTVRADNVNRNMAEVRKDTALVLEAQKVPLHAIGSQAHVNISTSFETMDQALAEMKTLGLPIHITELGVNSAAGGQRSTSGDVAANASTTEGGLVDDANRRQADAYAGIFRAFIKHRDAVKVVTFWGANDGVSWRAQGRPLLFYRNNQPKPAFDAVIAETKKCPAIQIVNRNETRSPDCGLALTGIACAGA